MPAKEGRIKLRANSFDDFVPPGQRNVLLLDDNLLSFEDVKTLLREMIDRRYAVNFSQTLDIAYLDDAKFELLRRIDSRNARFNKRMFYFSLNFLPTVRLFNERRSMLKAFGKDRVGVVCLYGFDTTLRQDYERFLCLRRLRLIPFFSFPSPSPRALENLMALERLRRRTPIAFSKKIMAQTMSWTNPRNPSHSRTPTGFDGNAASAASARRVV